MKANSPKLCGGSRACHAEGPSRTGIQRRRVGCGSIIRRAVDLASWIAPNLLRTSALTVVAGLSISSEPSLFAESEISVTPFKYEAPQSDLDDQSNG
jgi:hypothetical protein